MNLYKFEQLTMQHWPYVYQLWYWYTYTYASVGLFVCYIFAPMEIYSSRQKWDPLRRLYTPWSIKRFLTITLMFPMVDFYNSFTSVNRNECSIEELQNLQLYPQLCLHTTCWNLNHINSTFWSQLSQNESVCQISEHFFYKTCSKCQPY